MEFPLNYYATEKECQQRNLRSGDWDKSFIFQDGKSGKSHRRLKYFIYFNDPDQGPVRETRIIRSFPV